MSRRKLINIAVDYLIARHGYCQSSNEKINCAKEIIKYFPKLKDPTSEEGYVRIFHPYVTLRTCITYSIPTLPYKTKKFPNIFFFNSNKLVSHKYALVPFTYI